LEATYFYGSFSNSGDKKQDRFFDLTALSQLSYPPMLAGGEGLEPPTSGLAGNHLKIAVTVFYLGIII